MNKRIISPISIDLGAKNTGVYFAHYTAGSSLDLFKKQGKKAGKVYQLDSNNYTYLMAERTAKRHQRRGFDRRQMAKRLFKLIWGKHFGLKWDNDNDNYVQQTISFLMNRRGFTFLTEEYDTEILSRFPKEAYEKLPDELKGDVKENDDGYDFTNTLTEWANAGEKGKEKVQEYSGAILLKAYYEKIRKICQEKKSDDAVVREGQSVKLGDTPKNIFEKIFSELPNLKNRIETEEYTFKNDKGENITTKYKNKGEKFNILVFINNNAVEVADTIKAVLPQEQKEWFFNPAGNFEVEKSREKLEDQENIDIKLHLQHLAFALYKTKTELESGGRHRSKYFEEIETILKNKNHKRGYLKEFYKTLQSKECQSVGLTINSLHNLIGHISNLELKPLRKYFNAPMHKISKKNKNKEGDQWDEQRITKFFERWILSEWRINPEKDKYKTEGAKYDYKKLREKWKEKPGGIVDFWLETPPDWTIPPYQDNNNRRPPKCQSLTLNVSFLKSKYPKWQNWLVKLEELPLIHEYLGNYKEDLKTLESGKSREKKKKFYFTDKQADNLLTDSGRRSMAELDARILQFIFDRVGDEDPLNLNKIYSRAKKIKQDINKKDEASVKHVEEVKTKLKNAISKLPDGLKSDHHNGLFPEGSFLHLICKYYKYRQRARDGRIYIHPKYHFVKGRGYENTGRFDDKPHLLTYCNHKPRQKRYQMLGDLARILFTTEENLKSKIHISDEIKSNKDPTILFKTIESFFKEIKDGNRGLKSFMKDCADAQKDYGNSLKEVIDSNYRAYTKLKKDKGKLIAEKIQNIPDNNKISDKKKKSIENSITRLITLKEKSTVFAELLSEKIHDRLTDDEDEKEAITDKFNNPFSLAQIYNIVYKERNGNSKTCTVCSIDNSFRMDASFNEQKKDFIAKAQRLPAIPTRIIDGAVKRMARIVGGAIANDKWKNIRDELELGNEVCVPIITESNRFEFEPSREELVKGQRPKPRKGSVLERGDEYEIFASKEDRIKKASLGVCPYTDQELGNTGEIDHIIPRTSRWGTLNDETNLIWASGPGNQHKTNKPLSLANLGSEYKNKVFDNKSDEEIKNWVIDQIGEGSGEDFKFGKYRNFRNLTENQQKVFRHALFLVGEPIQIKVLNAINNRNRALVNGTQRYFSEVVANEIYKKYLAYKKERNEKINDAELSFDYFGIASDGSVNSVPCMRRKLENMKDKNGNFTCPELQEHKKEKGEGQTFYSHLLDAEIAFMIALSNHYRNGSFRIKAAHIDLYRNEYVDENGVLSDHDLYNTIKVPEVNEPEKLKRKKANPEFYKHKILWDSNPIAWHFLKLIEITEQQSGKTVFLKGFLDLKTLKDCLKNSDWEAALKSKYGYKKDDSEPEILLYAMIEEDEFIRSLFESGPMETQFGYGEKQILENYKKGEYCFSVKLHTIDKVKITDFLLKYFHTKSDPQKWEQEESVIYTKLQKLLYFTKRKKITDGMLKEIEGEKRLNLDYKIDDLKTIFYNPSLLKAWEQLRINWGKYKGNQDKNNLQVFLEEYFKNPQQFKLDHERVRKEFSLPQVSTGQGALLIKRKSWNKNPIFQIQSTKQDANSAGTYKKALVNKNLIDILTPYYRSENIVFLTKIEKLENHLMPFENSTLIDENQLYPCLIPENLKKHIESIDNKYLSKGDSNYKVVFKNSITTEGLIALMLKGFHIDEMKVGKRLDEKKEFEKKVQSYFKGANEYLSIQEAKSKLEKDWEELDRINSNELTEEQKENKQFLKKWLECLNSIQEDKRTLLYKRGAGLKIQEA